jgi:hypothetical protein
MLLLGDGTPLLLDCRFVPFGQRRTLRTLAQQQRFELRKIVRQRGGVHAHAP